MKFNIFNYVLKYLQKPSYIFFICFILVMFNVVMNGTLFQIRKFYLNKRSIHQKLEEIQTKNDILIKKLDNLSDPAYLEKEVRDRFDLAGQGDLIFIFPEDE